MLDSQTIDLENTASIMKSASQSFLELAEAIWFYRKEIAVTCDPHYSVIKLVINHIFLPGFFICRHYSCDLELFTTLENRLIFSYCPNQRV